MTVKWISAHAIIAIHGELIREFGGAYGPPDIQKLESTLARPHNLAAYSNREVSIFELAAALGYGLIRNHCFPDGNKRIGLSAIDVFLQINGHDLVATEVDAVSIIRNVAAGSTSEEELATWIRDKGPKPF